MVSLLRVFKFAFQDIGRNFGLSAMTVFILILMLISVNMLWGVKVLANETVRLVKDGVSMNIYLDPKSSDKDIDGVKNFLQSRPDVSGVSVISSDEVRANFENRHRLNPQILDALKEIGDNPFGPTIVVKTKEPESYNAIMNSLNVPQYKSLIESQSFEGHSDSLEKLQSITNRVENIGMGITLVFSIIAFLIIFNSIRVAIFTHKVEISIKRLVGAQNWFIRGPYIIEAIVFTLISIFIAGLCMYFVFRWIDPYLAVVLPSSFSLTNYFHSNILYLTIIETSAVLALTTLSSTIAMHKHLKV